MKSAPLQVLLLAATLAFTAQIGNPSAVPVQEIDDGQIQWRPDGPPPNYPDHSDHPDRPHGYGYAPGPVQEITQTVYETTWVTTMECPSTVTNCHPKSMVAVTSWNTNTIVVVTSTTVTVTPIINEAPAATALSISSLLAQSGFPASAPRASSSTSAQINEAIAESSTGLGIIQSSGPQCAGIASSRTGGVSASSVRVVTTASIGPQTSNGIPGCVVDGSDGAGSSSSSFVSNSRTGSSLPPAPTNVVASCLSEIAIGAPGQSQASTAINGGSGGSSPTGPSILGSVNPTTGAGSVALATTNSGGAVIPLMGGVGTGGFAGWTTQVSDNSGSRTAIGNVGLASRSGAPVAIGGSASSGPSTGGMGIGGLNSAIGGVLASAGPSGAASQSQAPAFGHTTAPVGSPQLSGSNAENATARTQNAGNSAPLLSATVRSSIINGIPVPIAVPAGAGASYLLTTVPGSAARALNSTSQLSTTIGTNISNGIPVPVVTSVVDGSPNSLTLASGIAASALNGTSFQSTTTGNISSEGAAVPIIPVGVESSNPIKSTSSSTESTSNPVSHSSISQGFSAGSSRGSSTTKLPPSTGATPSSPSAPRTSSGSVTSTGSVATSPTPTAASDLAKGTSLTLTSATSSGNSTADVDWDEFGMPLDFWKRDPAQQVIGCPDNNKPCCLSLPPYTLNSKTVMSWQPINTWVWSMTGEGSFKSAGWISMPDYAGGAVVNVCTFDGKKHSVVQKSTILTIPPKTITTLSMMPQCIEPNTETATRTFDPCDIATRDPPRVTATLQPHEMWQQPVPIHNGGEPNGDDVKFAACDSITWIVQPEPKEKLTCSGMPPILVSPHGAKDPKDHCTIGDADCAGFILPPTGSGGHDDDNTPPIPPSLLWGSCKRKGIIGKIPFLQWFAKLACTCGMFGCDGGCKWFGCGIDCGLIGIFPPAAKLLDAFGMCKVKCSWPCGHGGGIQWPPLQSGAQPKNPPDGNNSPTSNPPKPTPTSESSLPSSGSSRSSESCTQKTAYSTDVYCSTGTASTKCETTTKTTTGCTVTGGATTRYCSISTVTDQTVYCASGTSGTCFSTSMVASTLASGCDVSATTTTTYGPAFPAMFTALPDDDPLAGFDEEGGYPNWSDSSDPLCAVATAGAEVIPYDTILKPLIDDFCQNPGDAMTMSMDDIIEDFGTSSESNGTVTDDGSYIAWDHQCFFGNNETASIYVMQNPACKDKIDAQSCSNWLNKITDKCVSSQNKNDKVAGSVGDGKCFGYAVVPFIHLDGPKPPNCTVAKPSSTSSSRLSASTAPPNPKKDEAGAWKFQLGIQWAKTDYDSNANDRLEIALYGGEADADMNSCDFYWSRNDDAAKPNYGDSRMIVQRADLQLVTGGVKDLVDGDHKKLMPFDIRQNGDNAVFGTGFWPPGNDILPSSGACTQKCKVIRDEQDPKSTYVRCSNPTKDCDLLKQKGLQNDAAKYSINFRCEDADYKKISCNTPNGRQKYSNVGANDFMPLLNCWMHGKGSGIDDFFGTPVGASITTSASATPTPNPAAYSFDTIDLAMLVHWNDTQYKDPNAVGEMGVIAYRFNDNIDCDMFAKQAGDAYGYIEQALNTVGSAFKNTKIQKLVNDANGAPQPKPSVVPYNLGHQLSWPSNKCVKACEIVQKGDKWWGMCVTPDAGCGLQPPKPNSAWAFPCTDPKPNQIKCGNFPTNFYSISLICSGGDGGWVDKIGDTPNPKLLPGSTPPKPSTSPTSPTPDAKDLHDLGAVVVYAWTQGDYDKNYGSGWIQLWPFTKDGVDINCDFFNHNDIYHTNDEGSKILPGFPTVKEIVNEGKGNPRPTPHYISNFDWPTNGCMQSCTFQGIRNQNKDTEYWFICTNVRQDCNSKSPNNQATMFAMYCSADQGTTQHCGSDGKNNFNIAFRCDGNNPKSGWKSVLGGFNGDPQVLAPGAVGTGVVPNIVAPPKL